MGGPLTPPLRPNLPALPRPRFPPTTLAPPRHCPPPPPPTAISPPVGRPAGGVARRGTGTATHPPRPSPPPPAPAGGHPPAAVPAWRGAPAVFGVARRPRAWIGKGGGRGGYALHPPPLPPFRLRPSTPVWGRGVGGGGGGEGTGVGGGGAAGPAPPPRLRPQGPPARVWPRGHPARGRDGESHPPPSIGARPPPSLIAIGDTLSSPPPPTSPHPVISKRLFVCTGPWNLRMTDDSCPSQPWRIHPWT